MVLPDMAVYPQEDFPAVSCSFLPDVDAPSRLQAGDLISTESTRTFSEGGEAVAGTSQVKETHECRQKDKVKKKRRKRSKDTNESSNDDSIGITSIKPRKAKKNKKHKSKTKELIDDNKKEEEVQKTTNESKHHDISNDSIEQDKPKIKSIVIRHVGNVYQIKHTEKVKQKEKCKKNENDNETVNVSTKRKKTTTTKKDDEDSGASKSNVSGKERSNVTNAKKTNAKKKKKKDYDYNWSTAKTTYKKKPKTGKGKGGNFNTCKSKAKNPGNSNIFRMLKLKMLRAMANKKKPTNVRNVIPQSTYTPPARVAKPTNGSSFKPPDRVPVPSSDNGEHTEAASQSKVVHLPKHKYFINEYNRRKDLDDTQMLAMSALHKPDILLNDNIQEQLHSYLNNQDDKKSVVSEEKKIKVLSDIVIDSRYMLNDFFINFNNNEHDKNIKDLQLHEHFILERKDETHNVVNTQQSADNTDNLFADYENLFPIDIFTEKKRGRVIGRENISNLSQDSIIDLGQSDDEVPQCSEDNVVVVVDRIRKTRSTTLVDDDCTEFIDLTDDVDNKKKLRDAEREVVEVDLSDNDLSTDKENQRGREINIFNAKSQRYRCDMCNYSSKYSGEVTRHRRKHTGVKPFKCDVCDKAFMYKNSLRSHRANHSDEKPYICNLCDFRSKRPQGLHSHLKSTHSHIKAFICEICEKSYKNSTHLKHHQKSHNTVRPFKCDTCDYESIYEKDLKQHSLVHTSLEKKFECTLCDSKFRKRVSLNRHLAYDHEKKELKKCKQCSYTCKTNTRLREHVLDHAGSRPHNCWQCDKSFKTATHLKQHMRMHSAEKMFTCDECGLGFKHSGHLRRHKLEYKHSALILGRPLTYYRNVKKVFFCPSCPKKFLCNSRLEQHQFTHMTERPHACNICTKAFKTIGNLKMHKLVHNPEKPFSCSMCNYSSRLRINVKRHSLVHTSIRPYSCEVCDKAFRHSSTLTAHRLLHIVEKPFQCSVCDYSCKFRGEIKKHVKKHTLGIDPKNDRVYTCKICKVIFLRLSSLLKHRKIHRKKTMKQSSVITHTSIYYSKRNSSQPFRCKECSFSCDFLKELKIHKCKHAAEQPFCCDHCGYRCKMLTTLRSHMAVTHRLTDTPFICDECGDTFKFLKDYKRHLISFHFSPLSSFVCDKCGYRCRLLETMRTHYSTHEPRTDIRCKKCNFTCKTKRDMKLHHCDESSDDSTDENEKKRSNKLYNCTECGKGFKFQSGVEKHIKAMHDSGLAFTCKTCKFSTFTLRNFIRHVKEIHSDEELYICIKCGYTSKYLSSYKKHIRNGHDLDGKPFVCYKCGFKSTSINKYEKHVTLLHTMDVNFIVCDKCDYRCKLIRSMRIHYTKIHNPKKPFACKKCPYSCGDRRFIKSHKCAIFSCEKPMNQVEVQLENNVTVAQKEYPENIEVVRADAVSVLPSVEIEIIKVTETGEFMQVDHISNIDIENIQDVRSDVGEYGNIVENVPSKAVVLEYNSQSNASMRSIDSETNLDYDHIPKIVSNRSDSTASSALENVDLVDVQVLGVNLNENLATVDMADIQVLEIIHDNITQDNLSGIDIADIREVATEGQDTSNSNNYTNGEIEDISSNGTGNISPQISTLSEHGNESSIIDVETISIQVLRTTGSEHANGNSISEQASVTARSDGSTIIDVENISEQASVAARSEYADGSTIIDVETISERGLGMAEVEHNARSSIIDVGAVSIQASRAGGSEATEGSSIIDVETVTMYIRKNQFKHSTESRFVNVERRKNQLPRNDNQGPRENATRDWEIEFPEDRRLPNVDTESSRDDIEDIISNLQMIQLVTTPLPVPIPIRLSQPTSLALSTLPPVYSCGVCNMTFPDLNQLRWHEYMHVDNNKCPLCNFETSDYTQFEQHRLVHMEPSPSVIPSTSTHLDQSININQDYQLPSVIPSNNSGNYFEDNQLNLIPSTSSITLLEDQQNLVPSTSFSSQEHLQHTLSFEKAENQQLNLEQTRNPTSEICQALQPSTSYSMENKEYQPTVVKQAAESISQSEGHEIKNVEESPSFSVSCEGHQFLQMDTPISTLTHVNKYQPIKETKPGLLLEEQHESSVQLPSPGEHSEEHQPTDVGKDQSTGVNHTTQSNEQLEKDQSKSKHAEQTSKKQLEINHSKNEMQAPSTSKLLKDSVAPSKSSGKKVDKFQAIEVQQKAKSNKLSPETPTVKQSKPRKHSKEHQKDHSKKKHKTQSKDCKLKTQGSKQSEEHCEKSSKLKAKKCQATEVKHTTTSSKQSQQTKQTSSKHSKDKSKGSKLINEKHTIKPKKLTEIPKPTTKSSTNSEIEVEKHQPIKVKSISDTIKRLEHQLFAYVKPSIGIGMELEGQSSQMTPSTSEVSDHQESATMEWANSFIKQLQDHQTISKKPSTGKPAENYKETCPKPSTSTLPKKLNSSPDAQISFSCTQCVYSTNDSYLFNMHSSMHKCDYGNELT